MENDTLHDIKTLYAQLEMGAHRGQIISMMYDRLRKENDEIQPSDVVKFIDTNHSAEQISQAMKNLVSKND